MWKLLSLLMAVGDGHLGELCFAVCVLHGSLYVSLLDALYQVVFHLDMGGLTLILVSSGMAGIGVFYLGHTGGSILWFGGFLGC